jgi:transposase
MQPMNKADHTLPDDISELHKLVHKLQAKVGWYEEQFRLSQHKRFGASSEKGDVQPGLFNEAETFADDEQEPESEAATHETITYTRKKPGRKGLPADLPRKTERHELPESEQVCDCGHALHVAGETTSEQLEIIPAQIYVVEHVQVKYGCRACEAGIKTAPKPAQPIPRSFASPGLLAYIAVSKFLDSLPLYRQQAIFKRYNIELSRATMSNWVLKMAELLQPYYERLKFYLTAQPFIQADETTLTVVKDGRENGTKSYMWLYQSGEHRPQYPVVLYEYQATRAGRHAKTFLKGFEGYLQTDGFPGYHIMESDGRVTLLGCMAHVRRKFDDALKALPKESRKKPGKVQMALSMIAKLYAVEAEIKNLTVEQRYLIRQQKSKPLLEQFKAWCDKSVTQLTKDSLLGKAIRYVINQWKYLTRYIEDGALQIDNNTAEQRIKPFVIGRKNWLVNQTPRGADASAVLYSLVQTAKANNLEPFAFLKHLLTELPKLDRHYDVEELDQLLPWNLIEKIQPLDKVA